MKGLGGFGAEPGQVQQGFRTSFRRRSGRLWCRARSSSAGFRRRFWEALVQSQVRFNRVPEKGSGEGVGGFWCRARLGSTGFRRRLQRRFRRSLFFLLFVFMHVHTAYMDVIRPAVLFRVFVTICFWSCRFNLQFCLDVVFWNCMCFCLGLFCPRVASQHASERFVKRKRCSCWGYHRSFF